MAELNEHVAYLSQEIGPRPAGTEEEQRAALYISEQFSAEAGLTTAMEDFQCNPDSSLPRTLCSGVAVLVTLVATIVGGAGCSCHRGVPHLRCVGSRRGVR